jgi:hypothetical protein
MPDNAENVEMLLACASQLKVFNIIVSNLM